VLLLLAMTGNHAAILAGDALLFFAAVTLTGYSMYGLLIAGSAEADHRAFRPLVIWLVLGDLLLFELLLLLAHTGGEVSFASLGLAFLSMESPWLLLLLVVTGLGVRAGLPGMHYWLRPAYRESAGHFLPVLAGFSTLGVLGWWRIVPLGELYWPDAAGVLQLIAGFMLAALLLAALVRREPRDLTAYPVYVLAVMWLGVLAACLAHPGSWATLAAAIPAVTVQALFALVAVLLSSHASQVDGSAVPAWLQWGALLVLAVTPAAVAAALTTAGDGAAWLQMGAAAFLLAFIPVRMRVLSVRATEIEGLRAVADAARAYPPTTVATVFLLAAVVAAAYSLAGKPLQPVLLVFTCVIAGCLAGWASARIVLPGAPAAIAGGVSELAGFTRDRFRQYSGLLAGGVNGLLTSATHLRDRLLSISLPDRIDRYLSCWPNVMLALVLAGLAAGFLAAGS
jgi:formate hydrogenlyase subunit 3/multisubunit Na+/H+ antiporter MnhD subunit